MSGPGAAIEGDRPDAGYRGERLGLPEEGTNAVASVGRRLLALAVDWLLCYLIISGAVGLRPGSVAGDFEVLGAFAVENLLLVSTLGYTIGMRVLSIKVVRLGGPLTPLAVLLRTLLLCLVIPAVIWDRDTRAFHDRLSRTVVVSR